MGMGGLLGIGKVTLASKMRGMVLGGGVGVPVKASAARCIAFSNAVASVESGSCRIPDCPAIIVPSGCDSEKIPALGAIAGWSWVEGLGRKADWLSNDVYGLETDVFG